MGTSERTSIRNAGVNSRGLHVTPETTTSVNGFGPCFFFFSFIFFPVENSLLFLSDVMLAPGLGAVLHTPETWFSVSFLSDLG